MYHSRLSQTSQSRRKARLLLRPRRTAMTGETRMREMQGAVCVLLITLSFTSSKSQTFSPGAFTDTAMTPWQNVERNLGKYITPEYRERLRVLRSYQRNGYTNMLMRILDRDLLHALIDLVRMSCEIDYAANHGPIFYPSQTVPWFEVPFDWRFPQDPWKKESWNK